MSKTAAIITVIKPARMTKQGRHWVANWLRRQAALLERKGNTLSNRYTARYLYDAED